MTASARDCLAVVVLAFTLFGLLFLSGCSVAYPLGEDGRYGLIKAQVLYVPPINLWLNPAPFLEDK